MHDVQEDYGVNEPFRKCFDQSHLVVHGEATKQCNEGEVTDKRENVRECGRDYGAYNLQDWFEVKWQRGSPPRGANTPIPT